MVTVLSVLVVLSSLVLIASLILSESSEDGMGVLAGQGSSDSFWGSNKGQSRQAKINRATLIASIVFAVSLLLLARF